MAQPKTLARHQFQMSRVLQVLTTGPQLTDSKASELAHRPKAREIQLRKYKADLKWPVHNMEFHVFVVVTFLSIALILGTGAVSVLSHNLLCCGILPHRISSITCSSNVAISSCFSLYQLCGIRTVQRYVGMLRPPS